MSGTELCEMLENVAKEVERMQVEVFKWRSIRDSVFAEKDVLRAANAKLQFEKDAWTAERLRILNFQRKIMDERDKAVALVAPSRPGKPLEGEAEVKSDGCCSKTPPDQAPLPAMANECSGEMPNNQRQPSCADFHDLVYALQQMPRCPCVVHSSWVEFDLACKHLAKIAIAGLR